MKKLSKYDKAFFFGYIIAFIFTAIHWILGLGYIIIMLLNFFKNYLQSRSKNAKGGLNK